MPMDPEASVPPPQRDGQTVKELTGTGGGDVGTSALGNGFPNRSDRVDSVLRQAAQSLSNNWNKLNPGSTTVCQM